MTDLVRERALRVLREHERMSPIAIHNAIIDLRHSALRGDERLLYPFLEHFDAMVVSGALYTLFEVHGQREELRYVLDRLADGDARDDMATPIQSTAIFLLSRFGKQDAAAVSKILEVAEDEGGRDVPRSTAWQCLARLMDVEWLPQYTDELVLNPDSEGSDRVRNMVRAAIMSS